MASQEIKQVIDNTINSYSKTLRSISLKVNKQHVVCLFCACTNLLIIQIHDNPETGNKEYKAFHLLTDFLEKEGFTVSRGAVGLDTAFIAEYTNGKAGRRVAFCSEYDALPGYVLR